MNRTLFLLWMTAAFLMGSTVQTPASFHQATAENHAVVDIAQWWRVFHDERLNRLIDRAVERNLDVRVAAARVSEARAERGMTKSALLPGIGETTNVSQLRGGFSQGVARVGGAPGAPRSGSFVSPFETGIVQTGVEARWELDLFSGLRNSLKAATQDTRAREEARRDMLVVVTADVARGYLEVCGLQARIRIAQSNRDAQQETLDLSRVRAEAGLASELDVQRQAGQLAMTQAVIPALEASRDQTIHRLGVLLGDEPGALLQELQTAAAVPEPPPAVPTALPASLLTRRPDLRQADAEIAAATSRVGAARSELYPKFIITGLSGRQSTDFSGLTLGAGNFFSVGPGITLPFFTGGKIRSHIAQQQARLEQARLRYEQAALSALEETENALSNHHRERERRAHLQAAVDATRDAVQLAQELFVRGLGDFLAVLEAQRAQYQAEEELARSETLLRQHVVAVYKSLGGGW